jgi:hypothetical protein
MSVQKVVDKNTSAVGNNVVYDGQYSSSVFSRTLAVDAANIDALTADIVLGETSWTAALVAGNQNTTQTLTLAVKDAVGGTAVQVTDDAWTKGPNWTNATHKVVCQISSTQAADPAFGTDVGCITGGINTSGGAVTIVLTRNPTGASGGVANTGTASVVISVVKRNIATGTGGFS